MRITPLEIRQHTFDKSFRGYDTESVDAFLLSLSQEWERVSEELRQSKQQLEVAEREIIRMKEIENSLFKTLKAAEDAQQEINAKAQAEADLITDKAKQVAEEITKEAQKNADMVVSEAENKAKFLVENAVNDLKNYERDFKAMERYKDYLVVELKSFANDALDKVTKFEERINNRTNETRLNELNIKVAEKAEDTPIPTVEATPTPPIVVQPEAIITVKEESIETIVDAQKEIIVAETQSESREETEIDFEPANDFDDENDELPTVHAIVQPVTVSEQTPDLFNEMADSLTKEMKATRGRPRKIAKDDSLPTVSSVMEDFTKDTPPTISNGGGSFFDNI